MSKLEKFYIGIDCWGDLIIQESSYIESGFYIRELLCGGFDLMYISGEGTEPCVEGTFLTLKETFANLERLKKQYT